MQIRSGVVAVAALALVQGSALAQPQVDFDKVEIKPAKVAGSVYVLYGQGGNIGVSAGPDGILIIDDQFAPLAPKIKAALKGIQDAPLKWVLNTHFHFDHTGGNAIFGKEAPIIAHENVRNRLKAGTSNQGVVSPPAAVSALPVITFKDSVSVHFNGEEIRAVHYPNGHTDTDTIVFFTGSKVVHMGDHYFGGKYPFVDTSSGGSVSGLIANVEKVAAELPADWKVIPGHGEVTTAAELKTWVQGLKDQRVAVQAALAQKKTPDQLKKDKLLSKWGDKWATPFVDSDKWLDALVNDIRGPAAGLK
ncbi:MAG TPA: MBL fold metallo-hydrolase [Myxococcaceae bacterium]|nr:MBL fold metallo-hydrolase [Myxococcaceae bacterium]